MISVSLWRQKEIGRKWQNITESWRNISYHIISNSNMHIHLTEIPFAAICVAFIHVFDDELSQSLLRGCVQHLAGFHPAQTSPYYANPSPDFILLWGPQKKGWPSQQCFVKWVLCSLAEDLWYWPQSSKLFTLFKLSLSVANTMVWFVRRAFETIEKRGAFETVGENAPRELFQFKPWAFLIKSSLLFVFARRRVCK